MNVTMIQIGPVRVFAEPDGWHWPVTSLAVLNVPVMLDERHAPIIMVHRAILQDRSDNWDMYIVRAELQAVCRVGSRMQGCDGQVRQRGGSKLSR